MSHTPRITYIGHATMLIEMNGLRLLTDPVLRDRVGFIGRRSLGVDHSLLTDIDAVLVSHLHHDHLDFPSLRLLGRDTRIILPEGCGGVLRGAGFTRVEEIREGGYTAVDSVSIGATRADHDGYRHPFGPQGDCLGYVMYGESTVYFAGDTDIYCVFVIYHALVTQHIVPNAVFHMIDNIIYSGLHSNECILGEVTLENALEHTLPVVFHDLSHRD